MNWADPNDNFVTGYLQPVGLSDTDSYATTVTAHNAAHNGNLAPAASTSFGFIATSQTTNTQPTVTCTLR